MQLSLPTFRKPTLGYDLFRDSGCGRPGIPYGLK